MADLARKPAQRRERFADSDGMVRLGAARTLRQLAADLHASTDALVPRPRRKR